jgi:hypothetical protein
VADNYGSAEAGEKHKNKADIPMKQMAAIFFDMHNLLP